MAVHWVLLCVWIVVVVWRDTQDGRRIRRVLLHVLAFSVGPLLLWGGAVIYYSATDRLSEFLDAVFLFNLSYSESSETILQRFVRFFAPPRHPFTFDSAMPMWLGAIAATAWLVVEVFRERGRYAGAVLALLGGSFLAICLPGRFWPHYYYLLVPGAVVAIGMALGSITRFTGKLALGHAMARTPLLVLLFVLVPRGHRVYRVQNIPQSTAVRHYG